MPFIRKDWTAAEADEWTKEDWIVIVLSPLIYFVLLIGVALACLFMWEGFALTALGIVLTIVMHKIIDPKLRAISEEYEKHQQEYLQDLEATTRWQQ
jgi:hypothetical protein